MTAESTSGAGPDEDMQKIIIIGDAAVGKTCLIRCFVNQAFPENCPATLFDTYVGLMMINGKKYRLMIHDTPGQVDLEAIRINSYPGAQFVVICFSVDSPNSFRSIEEFWLPEVRGAGVRVPLLLAGTKSDRRTSTNLVYPCVTREEASELAKSQGFVSYVETSAKDFRNVDEVFKIAVMTKLKPAHKSTIAKLLPCLGRSTSAD